MKQCFYIFPQEWIFLLGCQCFFSAQRSWNYTFQETEVQSKINLQTLPGNCGQDRLVGIQVVYSGSSAGSPWGRMTANLGRIRPLSIKRIQVQGSGVLFLHSDKDVTAETKVNEWKVIFHIHLTTTLVQGIF